MVPPSLCSPTQYSLAKKSLSVGAHQTEAPQKNHIITNHNKALSTVFLPEAQLHPTLLQLEAFAHSYMPPLLLTLSFSLLSRPSSFHPSSFSCPCSKSYCAFGQTDTNEVALCYLHVSVFLELFCKGIIYSLLWLDISLMYQEFITICTVVCDRCFCT